VATDEQHFVKDVLRLARPRAATRALQRSTSTRRSDQLRRRDLPVARALEAAAATGAVGADAWADRMADVRAQFRRAVGRLTDESPEAMTDWIWARSHVSDWQHLVVERGWAPEDYVERCVASILADIAPH
jgi:hypothetical protein